MTTLKTVVSRNLLKTFWSVKRQNLSTWQHPDGYNVVNNGRSKMNVFVWKIVACQIPCDKFDHALEEIEQAPIVSIGSTSISTAKIDNNNNKLYELIKINQLKISYQRLSFPTFMSWVLTKILSSRASFCYPQNSTIYSEGFWVLAVSRTTLEAKLFRRVRR